MSLIQVQGIYKTEGRNVALTNITFTQQKLQKIAIAGETGSGKTTLLKIIGGIISPDKGQVLFENERLKRIPEEKLIPGHPGIAYLSQQFDLPHFLTVEQVLIYANPLPDDEAENDEQAKALYEVCRISHLLKRRTDQLSGGEKQRIALATLLITSPRLLLLDEPFSNLDMIHKNMLKAVINDIGERLNITCILVSHDPLDTLSWADEIIVMKDGQIVQRGTTKQVYNQPTNRYAAGLFGKYNLISAAYAESILGLTGIDTSGRSILFRPEAFTITGNDQDAIKGTINKITYYGSYYEINVLLAENYHITIRALQCDKVNGDAVYVRLLAEHLWFV